MAVPTTTLRGGASAFDAGRVSPPETRPARAAVPRAASTISRLTVRPPRRIELRVDPPVPGRGPDAHCNGEWISRRATSSPDRDSLPSTVAVGIDALEVGRVRAVLDMPFNGAASG